MTLESHGPYGHLKQDVRELHDRLGRFEQQATLSRERQNEQASHLAAALLKTTESVQALDRRQERLEGTVTDLREGLKSLTGVLTQHIQRQEDRWREDDITKGRILAEIGRLDATDLAAEDRDSRADLKMEALRAAQKAQELRTIEVMERAEADRARSTLRVGLGTTLGGAIVSYWKGNPNALQELGSWLSSLFGS